MSVQKVAPDEKKKPKVTVTFENGFPVFHCSGYIRDVTAEKNKVLEPYGMQVFNYGIAL